jgi:hypothetical protein
MPADIFGIAMGGVSLLEGIFSASDKRDQANLGISQVDKEMKLLRSQRGELEKFHDAKRGMLTDQYGNQVDRVVDKIGDDMSDINFESDRQHAKSGLAKSGTIDRRKRLTSQRRREGYYHERQSMFDEMQDDLLRGDVEREGGLASIDARMGGLDAQRDILKQQADTKFLGIFS